MKVSPYSRFTTPSKWSSAETVADVEKLQKRELNGMVDDGRHGESAQVTINVKTALFGIIELLLAENS